MWDYLREGFDYDLWANRLWLPYLQEDVDRSIMAHILSAQQVWVERLGSVSLSAMPAMEVSNSVMVALHERWLPLLKGEDRPITFRRTTGEEHTLTLTQIARHVLNHGTYHRGELRGLRRANAAQDFPETDMARYFLEPRP